MIRNNWSRLPSANIVISAPVTYDTKKLKWRGPGLETAMEEVYCSAGTINELKETPRMQDHPPGERVTAWTHLCDSLMNTFSIKKRLPISVIETKNKVKSGRAEKPWFNKTLRNQKNQASRELKKALTDTRCGRKSDTKRKNNTKFWELINGLNQGKNRHTNAGIDAATWEAHIQTMFSLPEHHKKEEATQATTDSSKINFGVRVTKQTDSSPNKNEQKYTLKSIDIEKLTSFIKNLKLEGAAGQNGIPNALFRGDHSFWAHCMTLLFNDVQGTMGLQDALRNGSIIHPKSEAGDPTSPSNYRLIALIDVEAKLYSACLLQQLAGWICDKHLIPQCRTGFRAGMGASTNLITLALLGNKARPKKKMLFACFIDLKAAFDCVPRTLLW
ncbi:hypothetical protein NDU88_006037 [Pleurodeles waltl]|uniref:Reverse transcriptase domain-containing protein n=1 Tax=Pleurodeles waltl TaxID=8319 RepID=A0AAV7NPL4_PLEWA|nr:hypothetical protein NDU88_006037 [Pleurodeles waltl]